MWLPVVWGFDIVFVRAWCWPVRRWTYICATCDMWSNPPTCVVLAGAHCLWIREYPAQFSGRVFSQPRGGHGDGDAQHPDPGRCARSFVAVEARARLHRYAGGGMGHVPRARSPLLRSPLAPFQGSCRPANNALPYGRALRGRIEARPSGSACGLRKQEGRGDWCRRSALTVSRACETPDLLRLLPRAVLHASSDRAPNGNGTATVRERSRAHQLAPAPRSHGDELRQIFQAAYCRRRGPAPRGAPTKSDPSADRPRRACRMPRARSGLSSAPESSASPRSLRDPAPR